MQRRPRAFYGYYHWQVYYLTRVGSILLPEGYVANRRIPVRKWLAHAPGVAAGRRMSTPPDTSPDCMGTCCAPSA